MIYDDGYVIRKVRPIEYSVTDSGCWECISHARDSDGYVSVHRNNQKIGLHRYAYSREYGPIPEGLVVMHKCDNPPCFNPSHLFVGSNADNMADKVAKGRQARGSTNGRAKLTERDVLDIRASIDTKKSLARKYQVDRFTIVQIKNKELWGHIPDDGASINLNERRRLTAAQVIEIRNRLSLGESHRAIAKSYGVGKSTITDINSGRIYAWVN